MQLNGISIKRVEIKNITPIFIETVSESKQTKMRRILNQKQQLSNHVIIEKDKRTNKYWLVAGYPEFEAYCRFYEDNGENGEIYAVIQPYSNVTEQRIILLRRMFYHQTTSWLDKQKLIDTMIREGRNTKYIADSVGLKKSEIERYLIHPDIPNHIIKKAYKNKGSFINLEKIRRLKIHPFIIDNLYLMAVLPMSSYERLTTEKLQKIKWLMNRESFYELDRYNQWEMISDAIDYKSKLLNIWDYEINERLNNIRNQNTIVNYTYINEAIYEDNPQNMYL